MTVAQISTGGAPAAGGHYSQGTIAGGFVFCAGQLGFDPETGKLAGDNVERQTQQALENIQAILVAAGTDIDNVVKTTVFLSKVDDFKGMNDAYAMFFGDVKPARSTVPVGTLPLGALVEIEAIAVLQAYG